tara:strand:+ start:540 stop:848 length:309 start_codon:yes stop_codon:yes gene_type:complete
MLSRLTILSFIGVFISFNIISAQPYGSHNSAKWQIWAYTSAAPDFIGDFASVKDGNGKVLREGTNGWVCLPFNPMPEKVSKLLTMGTLRVQMLHHWLGWMLI